MSEENNQSQDIEQNTADKKPADKQEWKKWLVITIAAFLGGFLCIYLMTNSINRSKERSDAKKMESFSQQLMDAVRDADSVEKTENYHSETEEISDDKERKIRIDDYEMRYKGKVFDEEFEKSHSIDGYVPEIELRVSESFDIKPVTVNANLEGEIFKVVVDAQNYSDDQIKYEFLGNKIRIFGETQVENSQGKKDLSFSQEIFLPAPIKKDEVEITHQGNKLIYLIPLNLED